MGGFKAVRFQYTTPTRPPMRPMSTGAASSSGAADAAAGDFLIERPQKASGEKNPLTSYVAEKIVWVLQVGDDVERQQQHVKKLEFMHSDSTVVKGDDVDGVGEQEEDDAAAETRIYEEAHDAHLLFADCHARRLAVLLQIYAQGYVARSLRRGVRAYA